MKKWLVFFSIPVIIYAVIAYSAEIRKLGSNDLEWATPNQGAATTTTSTGNKVVTKIDAAHIPWRNSSGYLDDLVNGSYNITLYPAAISGNNTGRIQGFTFGSAGETDNAAFNALSAISFSVNEITSLSVSDTTPIFVDNTLDGADIKDNSVTYGKLKATGTPSSSTFYRGDGVWASSESYVIPGSYKNLIIKSVTDDQSVDIDADYVIVADTNTNLYRVSSVNLTVVLDTSGANGRDTGSLAANTGYYLYVIYGTSGTAGLASTSATSPNMPSGYTYKALVGWCTTDGTSTPFNIEEFTQVNDEYIWDIPQMVVSGGGSSNTAAVNLGTSGYLGYAVVPPNIAKSIIGKVTLGCFIWFANPKTFSNSQPSNGTDSVYFSQYVYGATTQWTQYHLPLIESQTFYHQTYGGGGIVSVYVTGFEFKG